MLLVGLVGGLAMGAVAGARRTQSAFPSYLVRTNATDLQAELFSQSVTANAYSQALTQELAHLSRVRHVASFVLPFVFPVTAKGAATFPPALNDNEVSMIGGVNGQFFDQDRLAVAQGRMADPARASGLVKQPSRSSAFFVVSRCAED